METAPLVYDRTGRRRSWSAKWLVAVVVVTAVLAGWRWWPVAWQKLAVWGWSVQIRNDLIPPDILVVDADTKVVLPPPAQWIRFYQASEGSSSSEDAVLFIGERVAADGVKRVVEIGCRRSFISEQGYNIFWISCERNNLGMLRVNAASLPLHDCDRERGTTALYSGVADPTDTSHFTIRERRSDGTSLVDGYLMNDGSVKLETRPSPFSGRPEGAPARQVPLRGDR